MVYFHYFPLPFLPLSHYPIFCPPYSDVPRGTCLPTSVGRSLFFGSKLFCLSFGLWNVVWFLCVPFSPSAVQHYSTVFWVVRFDFLSWAAILGIIPSSGWYLFYYYFVLSFENYFGAWPPQDFVGSYHFRLYQFLIIHVLLFKLGIIYLDYKLYCVYLQLCRFWFSLLEQFPPSPRLYGGPVSFPIWLHSSTPNSTII
jgi:hypothetical protein